MPGLDDIAHTYTFYLFTQPSNFTQDAATWDAGRVYDPISVYDRMNFSTSAIADVPGVGAPLAANFMRVQDPNMTTYGTAANGTCSMDSGLSNSTGNVTHSGVPMATQIANGTTEKIGAVPGAGLLVVAVVAFVLL